MQLERRYQPAAGQLGRTAEGDVKPVAAVCAYSRGRDFSPESLLREPSLGQRRGERGILRPVAQSEADPLRKGRSAGGGPEASKCPGEVLGRRLSQRNQGRVGGEQD